MKKIILKLICLSIIINFSVIPVFAEGEILFSPSNKKDCPKLITNQPKIYKPVKLYLGEKVTFTIKAEPKSYVSFAMSDKNYGSNLLGIHLRLGSNIKTTEYVVPKTGILEININIPNDEALRKKKIFFEALVWKDKDYKDITLAKIISAKGVETKSNMVVYDFRPKIDTLPSLAPAIPGAPPELVQSMQYLEEMEDGEFEGRDFEVDAYNSKSVIIRNLRSPDLQKKD